MLETIWESRWLPDYKKVFYVLTDIEIYISKTSTLKTEYRKLIKIKRHRSVISKAKAKGMIQT